jgi:hypothetical protein
MPLGAKAATAYLKITKHQFTTGVLAEVIVNVNQNLRKLTDFLPVTPSCYKFKYISGQFIWDTAKSYFSSRQYLA